MGKFVISGSEGWMTSVLFASLDMIAEASGYDGGGINRWYSELISGRE
jgi:hypothetical protein